MIFSFPIGMFVIFHTNVGGDISYALPLGVLGDFELGVFSGVELGDVFIIVWALYLILFAIAMMGPNAGFQSAMSPILSNGYVKTESNYMVAITKWFSITILVSVIINFVQEGFEIHIVPPTIENNLIQFFYVSISPLIEEIGFRVLLIGLPLFAFYGHKFSAKYLLKVLWNPSAALHIHSVTKAIILIVLVGVMFGFAHILSDESWSEGKFAQAAAGGIILGWVYFRFGFVVALLIHWATNYFIFAYVNFVAQTNDISINAAFLHPLITTMEILFLVSGALAVIMIVGRYYISKHLEI